jgi:sugar phosphate isomerase/epimerase
MGTRSGNQVYFSFFMFTANLQPDDPAAADVWIRHIKTLVDMGYSGFDLPIAPPAGSDPWDDVGAYEQLKARFDRAGLKDVGFTTNVGTTRTFDPTSPYSEQRASALEYLKSRVEITRILGSESIMAGPVIFPYGQFPTTDAGLPLWSDALQDWLAPRYRNAAPILQELGVYAAERRVKVAIEPVDHWETPAPNMVSDVLQALHGVPSAQIGLTIDSAHVALGSTGPEVFRDDVRTCAKQKRLHYVHVSPPDRGQFVDSWLPWDIFLSAVLPHYDGPLLLEVFNAVEPFTEGLRITRRKFWIPDEDPPRHDWPSAYQVAQDGIAVLREKIDALFPAK